MKPLLTTFMLIVITTHAGWAQTPQYAGDPLTLGAGARALGMGGSYVALSQDATATYWNPSGLADLSFREIHVQHAEQFGGSINHDILAIGIPITNGGIGISLIRAGVEQIALTSLEDPSRPLGPGNRPIVTQTVNTSDYLLRVAYGRRFTNKLQLGAGLKIIRRDLSVGVGNGLGLDIGLLYLPTPNVRIGATVYDLTKTRVAFPNGITDHISPSLLIGLALQHKAPSGQIIGSVSMRLNDKKSSAENSRSIQLGTEYTIKQRIAFRLGIREGHFSAGAGLLLRRFGIDLAFLEHDQLDSTYRISATLFF